MHGRLTESHEAHESRPGLLGAFEPCAVGFAGSSSDKKSVGQHTGEIDGGKQQIAIIIFTLWLVAIGDMGDHFYRKQHKVSSTLHLSARISVSLSLDVCASCIWRRRPNLLLAEVVLVSLTLAGLLLTGGW